MIVPALLLLAAAPPDPCAGDAAPPRRMTGIFVNEFEGPRFYEHGDPTRIARHTPFAWFDRMAARQATSVGSWPLGHVFRIEVIATERAAPAAPASSPRPCLPTAGEYSRIDAVEIVAQEDLGDASVVLPPRG